MDTIFGPAWEELQPSDVVRFLDRAGSESLTWEAKADGSEGLRAAAIRNEICAFGNSELGGYLVIGAKQVEGGWVFKGLGRPPKADLTTWISEAARGVTPTPAIQVHSWPPVRGRGQTAVIWVPPVAEPPAMTTDGLVFQRLPGQTSRVNDPQTLAGLFERGRAAVSAALVASSRAVAVGIELVPASDRSRLLFAFGAAATGPHRDLATGLFTESMIDRMQSIALQDLKRGAYTFRPTVGFHQRGLSIWIKSVDSTLSAAFVGTDGSVGIVTLSDEPIEEAARMLLDGQAVERVWRAASALLKASGASGRMNAQLSTGHESRLAAPPRGATAVSIERWTTLDSPTEDEVQGVRRELARALGRAALEEDG